MTIPTDGRIDLDALAERLRGEANFILGDAAAWGVDTYGDQPRTVRLLLEAADAIDLACRAAIPSEQGEAVAFGSEDDPESLAYALRIGAMGTPFNDYQGTLYMNPRYKADDFRDAEFRDHGLARAVRVILNNAEAIRAALAHPAPAAGVKVKALEWRTPDKGHPMEDMESTMLLADGIGGKYHISHEEMIDKNTEARGHLLWWAYDEFVWTPYGTVAEAKAAAQADYEARILSALDQGEPK